MSDIPRNENNLNTPINNVEDHNTITNSTTDDVVFETSSKTIDDNTKCSNNLTMKIKHLKECLNSDIHSCDFTWSLFQSALNSYRFDSCLRPYPPMFLKNGYIKEPSKMKSLSELVSDMHLLRETIDDKVYPKKLIELLHWVLISQRDPYLKILQNNNQPDVSVILNFISEKQLSITPNYMFEVMYSKHQEEQWQQRKSNRGDSIFAFHGSRLDNFYSILKFGLQQHMSATETLFGAGIYLTSELMLSLTYSPSGTAWEKSMFGSVYSIVALCEIINDTEKVKCQDISHKNRCVNVGSIGGTVPDKYYVVLNSDLVRIRYLLVFKQSGDPKPCREMIKKPGILRPWLRKNKMMIMLILYTLLLLMVGFFNSQTWHKYQRAFINQYFNDDL